MTTAAETQLQQSGISQRHNSETSQATAQQLQPLLKMDPEFWQQARNPFGLQYLQQQHHHQQQQQQQQQQQHNLPPTHDHHIHPHPHSHHHHHQHQTQHSSLQHAQQPLAQQPTHQPHHEQSHHLLFNAAAAAHLTGVVRPHDVQQSSADSNQNDRIGNVTKQEVQNNSVGSANNQHQQQPITAISTQQKYGSSNAGNDYNNQLPPNVGAATSTASNVTTTSNDLYTSKSDKQLQSSGANATTTETHSASNQTGSIAQQLPPPTTHHHGPSSPLHINTLTANQSPQHSLTPSGGSSTPDVKYNNDKLANEIQLQLSRSNSAAAISERTLEECWSTLQRLFMHKSAMQQIQQIPRVGLGAGSGPGSLSADTKPHQCQQCMKSFSSNHQLVQHIRVHTGEKPYKCSYCDRRFKQLSHVQQHTRLHTGERPYKCHLPDCGRAFIQLSNLQQHLRNHDAQVERAKNRPFHCNICGKGFATESSLRTHTSKELQLHLGVLQQHAALIGGPSATSCPVCHKLFLGTDALMEHMKNAHKEKSPQAGQSSFSDNLSSSGCLQPGSTTPSNDPYLAKRRTANHPCPICGKHYVNEGSLRKHLASHPETSQLTNSLRMWPCSVCQAVFTHENGLLTHMEHMRMDPKHQFAAQYVLSRAAAERRERDSLLAATLAGGVHGVGGTGCSMLPLLGESGETGVSNSLCPSPSGNSECSSTGRLSSSTPSEHGSGINLLNNNNNNNNNNNSSNNNNNSGGNNNNNNNNTCTSNSNKLNELLLRSSGSQMAAGQYGVDAAVQAAVVNLAAAMRCSGVAGGAASTNANTDNTTAFPSQSQSQHQQQQQQQQHHGNQTNNPSANMESSGLRTPPTLNASQLSGGADSSAAVSAVVAMNVMRDMTMMRGGVGVGVNEALVPGAESHIVPLLHQHGATMPGPPSHSYGSQHASSGQQGSLSHPNPQAHHHVNHLGHLNHQPHQSTMQQHAEAILRSHTEAAFRLAASVAASNGVGNANASNTLDDHQSGGIIKSESQALQKSQQRLGHCNEHETQTNQLIQSQTTNSGGQHHEQKIAAVLPSQQHQQQQQQQQEQQQTPSQQQQQQQQQQQPPPHQTQLSNDHIQDAIRLQEQRLEQALRLHNDARALSFFTGPNSNQQGPHHGGIQQTATQQHH